MSPQERIRTVNAQYICTFRPELEGGYTVLCAAFPEIVSYGTTLEEARSNAREAIELCLEVYRERGDALPLLTRTRERQLANWCRSSWPRYEPAPSDYGPKDARPLQRAGFVVIRSKGSHHFLEHRGDPARRTVIAMHPGDLPQGTVQDIFKQARLTRDEFMTLL